MSLVDRIAALAERVASEIKAAQTVLAGLGSLARQDAGDVEITGGSIGGVSVSGSVIDGGELAASRENTIAVVRATRAELVAQASAGQLIAGEPYLIIDEGRLAWAISATEFKATVMQDDLEGFTFFSQ